MNELILLPLIYESIIFLIALIMNIFIIKRHRIKNTPQTRLLTIQFLFYLIAIFFTWMGKLMQYLLDDFPTPTSGIQEYFIVLIWDIRLALIMLTAGMIFSHFFKVEVFDAKAKDTLKNKGLTGLGFLIIIISFVLYDRSNSNIFLIIYGLVFLYDLIIYVSIMIHSIRLSKRIEDKIYKNAIQSIGFMAWCFIAIFLCFLLDQIVAIIAGWPYNIFYYLAWVWALLALISSYLGYIRPSEVQ